ncbi:MAG: pilus assembly protein PilM, partial [Gammaproteobacteria bacterium]|nr:pilus assembly protein PilM [Gammaproteobacteria bacterium]
MSALARLATRWRPAATPKNSFGPIGIDLTLERMHLVQFRRDANSELQIRAQTSVAYPVSRDDVFETPHALTPLLKAALRNAPFSGRRAVIALPGGTFRTMSVVYQVAAGQSEAKILTSLMQDRIDGELSDYVIDFIPVRKSTRDSERLALVAASPRVAVTRFLEEFRRAGLEIETLEIGPLGIRRLVNSLPDMSRDDNVVVVNTGRATTYVTVLAGRRLLSDQDFRFGEDALLKRLSDSLDMSADSAHKLVMRTGLAPSNRGDQVSVALNESGIFNTLLEIVKPELMRLVTEIERAVLFTASETHGGKVSRIYLAGALSRWRGVDSAL